jgi:hypothetical protein
MSSLQVAGQVVVEVDAPRLTSSSPRTGLLYATATCCTKQHHQVPFLFARSWHQSLLCRKRKRACRLRRLILGCVGDVMQFHLAPVSGQSFIGSWTSASSKRSSCVVCPSGQRRRTRNGGRL